MKNISFRQIFFLTLYYGIGYHLPCKTSKIIGGVSARFRYFCCKHIFQKIGFEVNIERHAYFGSGIGIEIGNYSGLGINCHIPNDTIIGDYVMMGPNCYIFSRNHCIERMDIPMLRQGVTNSKQTIIGNDVWIGRDVMMSPGRHIADGTVVGMRCVLTKDFPPYSIVGGAPCKLLKYRKNNEDKKL